MLACAVGALARGVFLLAMGGGTPAMAEGLTGALVKRFLCARGMSSIFACIALELSVWSSSHCKQAFVQPATPRMHAMPTRYMQRRCQAALSMILSTKQHMHCRICAQPQQQCHKKHIEWACIAQSQLQGCRCVDASTSQGQAQVNLGPTQHESIQGHLLHANKPTWDPPDVQLAGNSEPQTFLANSVEDASSGNLSA